MRHTSRALDALHELPSITLGHYPTPVEELPRLRATLGGGPRLLIKRDDAIPFGWGGNKVRKLEIVAARAHADGADTLITTGGVQSNHCRVTAAAAAKLGMKCAIVANGAPPATPTANALLVRLLGAEVHYVAARDERAPAMEAIADELRGAGRKPFIIPLGASTPLGALGLIAGVAELVEQIRPPDAIVHATSSGGTQAGLVVGCRLFGLHTRVIGISADDPVGTIQAVVSSIITGMGQYLDVDGRDLLPDAPVEVDDSFVGEGYGVPTPASTEAIELLARTEAIFLDHTYTGKAMAGLIAYVRGGRFRDDQTVLFWHTGGQVALFA
jgi:1-aminocyclopropane-1-carboxylate deaminase/D-cysteine desulfhydrase-like pyridoxal-dependent ACC family enzyme